MAGDLIITLISVIALVPIFATCCVIVLKWTLMGEIDPFAGVLTIIVLAGTMFLALMSKSGVIQAIATVGAISLIVMFPFAQNYLDRHDLKEINSEHIDRAILELSIHPDNFPAWFKLADSLFIAGYHGHAIALAEQTIERIPTTLDPLKNQTLRDLYKSEEIMVKKWRAQATNPKRHMPLSCPKCGQKNRPGTINCIKCEAPYLLLLSRNLGSRSGVFAKLVIGWALIAMLIPSAALLGEYTGGGGISIGIGLGAFGLVGVILWWIFKDRSGQPEKFQSFS